MGKVKDNIVIENADIGFRNFSGEEQRFNPAGSRNFVVFLDTATGEALAKDGWNIKWLQAREEGDEDKPYLPVALNYNNFPPKIVMITSNNKTIMTADTVNILDWAEFKHVDLIVNPYNWEVNGKTGVKAYVKSMYITIIEDVFEQKYNDIPDSGTETNTPCVEFDDDDVPF